MLSEEAYKIYEKDGYSAVFEWVMKNSPELNWSHCEPCELKTPTDGDGDCLVCATPKGGIIWTS